jgi:long-chain acyl-CoA synthetase
MAEASPCWEMMQLSSSFLERLSQHADRRPQHAAVVTASVTLNYGDLLRRVQAGLEYFRGQGIVPGAVVGLTLEDEVDHLIATLSLMAAGAGQITLATHDTPMLRARLAERVDVSHVVAASDAYRVSGTAFIQFPRQEVASSTLAAEVPAALGSTLFLKTSGTTGDMNIVAFREEQIAAQAHRHDDYADERLLRLASIEHNNSKRHRLYCVWAGGTNVFRPREATDIVDYSLRHAVSCLDISRMHASDLAASHNAHELGGIKLRTGGSEVPFDVRCRIQDQVTRNLYVRYAATECGGIAMARPGEHDAEATVGRLLDDVELQIVDADDKSLPPGSVGEIRLRAPGMATEYFDSPDDSARRFRHNWFYPGDVGYLRADGQLVIQGRKDDMIILNGLNICPAEIERVLESHPAVSVAAALSLPSRVHGQIPVAAVELHPNAIVTTSELQHYARQHLALRTPRRILILARLPRNSQGKIMRRELRPAFQPMKSET